MSESIKSPQQIARRWKIELKLADKREEKWREKAKSIYKQYTPENPATNSFNILWTNTETLRQAVYNSLPDPRVIRRYKDEDELGKNVSTVLERALEFSQDTYDFDGLLKGDVLCMLLAGRALSRVKYIPSLTKINAEESNEPVDSDEDEMIEWEQVVCERIQHDDFRILSTAKTWDDVNAIAIKHSLSREDLIEKFGEEIGNKIPLDSIEKETESDVKSELDKFKTAEIWEIWDKEEKQVLFISKQYDVPLKIQSDPLKLCGFFPVPRPLYAIENDTSLVPSALYTQYEQQAKELNRISGRINSLINALKVRGIYDSTLGELSQLMKAGDNDLIAAQNVTALLERGGLDKAIWMMPIDVAAAVLKELYMQRDATKQVIYEITGISDIMRSASDPNETFGAQKIKTQWGTQRLQKIQKEVQRYIRDLIRLKAEIIAEKFQMETLEQMTLIKLPHQADIDAQNQPIIQRWQQQAQIAAQSGQPIPQQPKLPKPITWEAVMEALQNNASRIYHVDIETDSTLSASQDSDMQGLRELLQGIGGLVQQFAPAVQAGAIPIDAVKEIIMAAIRRAKMGSAVEDAFSKMQAPQPQSDPHAAEAQAQQQAQQQEQAHQQQIEQIKAQSAIQLEQLKHQNAMQIEQAQMQADQAVNQQKIQLEVQSEQAKYQYESQLDASKKDHEINLKQIELQHKTDLEKYKIDMEYRKSIEVAEIAANATLQASQISAAKAAQGGNDANL